MNSLKTAVMVSLGALLIIVAGCNRSLADLSEHHTAAGKKYNVEKDYRRAVLELRNAIKIVPTNAEAYYQMGITYAGIGDVDSSALSFMKAVELNPKHKEAQLKLSLLLLGTKNPEFIKEAEKRLTEVLAFSPGNSDALHELGLAELQLGKTTAAVELLEQSMEKVARLDSSVTLANLKLAQKDFKGAESILRRTVGQLPKSADARVAMARYYVVVGNPVEAEIWYRRVLEVDPNHALAMNDLGLFMLRLNRPDDADKIFRSLAALKGSRYKAVHALFLSQIGKRGEAVAELEQMYKREPNDRQIRNLLVLGYNLTNRFMDAENIVNTALKKNPKDGEALDQRARIRLAAGRLDDALKDVNEMLRQRPDSGSAHYLLARIHLARGATSLYRQELNEALRADPALLTVRTELSSVLRTTNAAQAALSIMDSAPDFHKRDPAYLAERNWVLLATGDKTKSRAGIDLALAGSKSVTYLLQDAVWKLRNDEGVAARASLEEALAREPENIEVLRLLAASYFKEKRVLESVARVRIQVAKYPKSPHLQFLLGAWLQATGDKAAAREAYQIARTLDPSLAGAELALARLDYQDGNRAAARQTLLKMLPVNARNSEILLLLGMVEDGDNHTDEAIAYYQRVVAVNPDNIRALNNLAWHLVEDRKLTGQALQMAQHAQELAPEDPEVNDTLGWILYQQGLYPSAAQHFENALAHDPAPLYRYHLAMAYLQSGNYTRGAENLQKARQQNPNLPEAKIANALLAKKQ